MFGVFLAQDKQTPATGRSGPAASRGAGVTQQEMRLVDQRLPRAFQGNEGFDRLVRQVRVRVSVASPREHLRLAAMAMEALRGRGFAVYPTWTRSTDPWSVDPAREDEGSLGLDRARLAYEIKRAWPVDALVVRNRSATAADFRTFHTRFIRPHYVLVSRVTRDAWGQLARDREAMAELIGRSVPRDATLISGEPNPDLRQVLRDEVEDVGGRFVDASPVGAALPNLEFITILDAMLHAHHSQGLSADELRSWRQRIQERYRWRPSVVAGLDWFHAVDLSLQDADAIQTVVDALNRSRRRPLVIAAYLRDADAAHNYPAVPFLRRLLDDGSLTAAYLAGPGAAGVANHFRDAPVYAVPETPAYVPKFLQHLAQAHPDHGLVTLASGAPPWARAIADALQPPAAPSAEVTAAAPPGLQAAILDAVPPPSLAPAPLPAQAPVLPAPSPAPAVPLPSPRPLAQRLLHLRRAWATGAAAAGHSP